jgi:hypothetical protein
MNVTGGPLTTSYSQSIDPVQMFWNNSHKSKLNSRKKLKPDESLRASLPVFTSESFVLKSMLSSYVSTGYNNSKK